MPVSSWTRQQAPCAWHPAVRIGCIYGILPQGVSWTVQDPPWTSGMNRQVIHISFPDPLKA